MTRREFIRSLVWTTLVLVLPMLLWPVPIPADQTQHFYGELGRLVGAVDGQGNIAVYNYDEVGNLVSIQRFTSSGGGQRSPQKPCLNGEVVPKPGFEPGRGHPR